MASETSLKPWIVCQVGAREHYAIPRALKRTGVRVTLATDYWHFPQSARFVRRLTQRCHPELNPSEIVSFNRGFYGLELYLRLRGFPHIERCVAANEWFGQRIARALPKLAMKQDTPPVVFSYSYAASDIFAKAKSLGLRTILGQIDPGPEEERVVLEAYRKHGIPTPPIAPEHYWNTWRRECELADQIMVNSDWSRQGLIKAGIEKTKICIVPLAYDKIPVRPEVERVCRSVFTDDKPLQVLFLGQIIVRKGIAELADAIRRLESKPIEWTFVGGGESSLLELLGKLPKTKIHGSVSRSEVDGFYRRADVFILPTHSDGFALTQLEAASYGLPIIASKYCGEVVQHERNGLLLPSVETDAIVETIKRLLDDPSMLESMRQTQRQTPIFGMDDLGRELVRIAA